MLGLILLITEKISLRYLKPAVNYIWIFALSLALFPMESLLYRVGMQVHIHANRNPISVVWSAAPVWGSALPRTENYFEKITYYRPANNNYCFYNQFPGQAYFLADFFQPDTLYAPKMLGEEMSNGFGYQPVWLFRSDRATDFGVMVPL